ncbi:uncharacterized protein DUF115 [Tumebacillus sp. BK434]|nr:uncharacterized protein DUF115 [Tumebacillus sp. BK434]
MRELRASRSLLFESLFSMQLDEQNMTVRVEASKAGMPTLYLSRGEAAGLFHSRYQPLVEAERWAAAHTDKNAKNLAFFGFGLGYQIRALREAIGADKGIIVLEPSWEVFDTALGAVDLRDLLKDENLHLIIGGTARQLARQMGALAGQKMFEMDWLEWPAFRRFYGNEYLEEFSKELSRSMRDARLDQNTVLYFQREWPRNILYNLPAILKNPGINALQNKFNKKPAIIVSAGPSLSKNVEMLHEIKDKAVILCVDTAYRVLQTKGIQPDLIFSLDGSELNYRHFTGVRPEGIPLVMVPNVHHKIIEEYGQRVFSANIFDMLVSEVVKQIEPKGLLSVSGSVATLAFSTACRMGCDPVIFIGQDLAYPGGQAYSKGTMFETMTKTVENGFMMRHVEGIDGMPVLTDAQLDSFRVWFEVQIEEYEAGRTFVDATEGGAKIHGTEIMTLREAVDRYCTESFDIQGVIEKVSERRSDDLNPSIMALRTMSRTLYQIRRLAKLALIKNQELRELYKLRRLRAGKVAFISAMLDRIEEHIKRLNGEKWLDAPMQHLLLVVTRGRLAQAPENETDHAKAMRVTENAKLLYQGMVQTAEELKDHVEVALRRLETETIQGEKLR